MNTRMFAHDAGLVTAVTAVVTGAGFVAWSVSGVVHERDRLRATAAGPRPTVTATATVVQRVPYPEPTLSASRTVEAADAPGRTPGAVRAQEAPAAGGTSQSGSSSRVERPVPSPHPSPAPSSCPSGVLTVQLPLGALPECAITIGGN